MKLSGVLLAQAVYSKLRFKISSGNFQSLKKFKAFFEIQVISEKMILANLEFLSNILNPL